MRKSLIIVAGLAALAGCSKTPATEPMAPDPTATDSPATGAISPGTVAASAEPGASASLAVPDASAAPPPAPKPSPVPTASAAPAAAGPAAGVHQDADKRAAVALKPEAEPVMAAAVVAAPPAFMRCAVCHNAAKGAGPKIGPNLYGVYGTKAGAGSYAFSAPLKASGLVWNDETLDKWIAGPMTLVPGTLMAFPGIKDAGKRAEIIAYLKA